MLKNVKLKILTTNFKLNKLSGQTLHAKSLGFNHPSTNKWISFDSNLPKF